MKHFLILSMIIGSSVCMGQYIPDSLKRKLSASDEYWKWRDSVMTTQDTINLLDNGGWKKGEVYLKADFYSPSFDSVKYETIELNGKKYPLQINYRKGEVIDSVIWNDDIDRKRDTILAFCMYSDTSKIPYVNTDYHTFIQEKSGLMHYKKDTTYYSDYKVNYGYFYSVRELHNTTEGVIDPGIDPTFKYEDYYQHLYYLDKDKKPLSKNIIVWMAK